MVIVKAFFTSSGLALGDSRSAPPLFNTDAKIIQRMGPMLQRVLIVDPQPAAARLLSELMRDIARSQICIAETRQKAMRLAEGFDPQIIFADLGPAPVDGVALTRELRRSTLACRYAPVIMVTGQATAGGILAARDAGVHEFLRRPFTLKDLLRRLEAVTLRQRDWVEAVGYVGPDRRRFNSGDYSGALKRRSDTRATPDSERLAQAVKILRSAIAAIGSDPSQAMRSMQAQVTDLRKCGMSVADLKLTTAAIDFGRYLDEIERKGPPYDAAQLSHKAGALLAYMPKDEPVPA
ncbi:MAG: response regulator [Phenylobacterium sp.]|nr:response regulator [Phenylobacterium sp.]MDB5500066.1 response regulator [Phenylobacterium sp.]